MRRSRESLGGLLPGEPSPSVRGMQTLVIGLIVVYAIFFVLIHVIVARPKR